MNAAPRPLTVAAVTYLQSQGAGSATQARTLLRRWPYYPQMTRADVAQVLSYYGGSTR